jgi:hypothetical protein
MIMGIQERQCRASKLNIVTLEARRWKREVEHMISWTHKEMRERERVHYSWEKDNQRKL